MNSDQNTLSTAAVAPSQPIATRIPAEILIQIIDQLQNRYSPWTEYPWPYTYVCRYWREVLIAEPHLWTTINLDVQPSPQEQEGHLFERLALQLERTGSQPFFLSTHAQDGFDPKVFELLVSHHNRWKEAELDLFASDMTQLLCLRESWSFDRLSRLELRTDPPSDEAPLNLDMFMQAPQLQVLHLMLANLSAFNFPWSRLTSLTLTHVYAELGYVQQVFGQCTSLVDLELAPLNIDGQAAYPDMTISLPHLDALTYEVSDEPGNLLQLLHMPALELLTLTAGAPLEQIQSCFLLSNPPLTTLQLSMIVWRPYQPEQDAATLKDILRMVPTLEYLGMTTPPLSTPGDRTLLNIVLSVLEYNDSDPLCPNLGGLALHFMSFSDATSEPFMRMLTSRSIVAREEYTAALQSTLEELKRSAQDTTNCNAEEARAALRRVNELRTRDFWGLKATLTNLTVSFEEERSMENCFSKEQLDRIKVLTIGMNLYTSAGE